MLFFPVALSTLTIEMSLQFLTPVTSTTWFELLTFIRPQS
jgi:hypothetical protein